MKVVFGGAFNPVTNAHIKLYEHIMKNLDVTEFIFLPVSNAYTKSELVSNYHRLAMLKLALKDYPDVDICEMEMDDSNFLGTYQSLIRLYDKDNEKIAFVIGADNLPLIEKWINVEGILSEFKIIVLGRNNIDISNIIKNNPLLSKFSDSFIRFDDFKENISSTSFRDSFDKNLVNELVYEYIIDNSLYRGDDDV
jgi:nicotinate-nucleotide adenylyltransferase